VEPSCGVAISSIYKKIPEIDKYIKNKNCPTIVLIVCGGNSVNIDDLQNYISLNKI
jgi:hypothetical protein